MLERIIPSPATKDFIIEKLKEKTNYFDYVTVSDFLMNIEKRPVWTDGTIYVIGDVHVYLTGTLALSLTVCNVTDEKAQNLQESLKQIEQEAKAAGLNRIILDGRYGWKKLFPDYSLSSVKLIKEI